MTRYVYYRDIIPIYQVVKVEKQSDLENVASPMLQRMFREGKSVAVSRPVSFEDGTVPGCILQQDIASVRYIVSWKMFPVYKVLAVKIEDCDQIVVEVQDPDVFRLEFARRGTGDWKLYRKVLMDSALRIESEGPT